MANYDFQTLLSPIDFEHLVRDLLSRQLDIELSTFAEGADNGIDIRYCSSPDNSIVVQCKRMKSVTKEIIDKEYEKVVKLNPNHYYFVCSNELSVSKVDYIKKKFERWMKGSDEFIYYNSKLNHLLEEFQDVHQKHYKLWLHSSSMFNAIINQPLYERAKSLINDIRRNNVFYVRNESLNRAIDILNNNQFVIISGIPGIGKSTLAKLILWEYLQKGFEILEIRKVIEGEQFLIEDSESKQVFYYDDFLGENFLKYDVIEGRANDLIQLIARIKNSRNKVLIMTTREYILNQAKETYEKLDDETLNLAKHTLDLSSYSKKIKSLILYNHLYYSRIPIEYIENILLTKSYRKIIAHENYNPRIIEQLTVKLVNISPENYAEEFLNSLDKPFGIWNKAFSSQISNGSKIMLILLLSVSGPITLSDFKQLVTTVSKKVEKPLGMELHLYNFQNYLKELENSFIKIELTNKKNHIIDFLNPSIKDFLLTIVRNDQQMVLFLIGNSLFHKQLVYTVRYLAQYFHNDQKVLATIDGKILEEYQNLISSSIFLHNSNEYTINSNEMSKLNSLKFYLNISSDPEVKTFLYGIFKNLDFRNLSYYDQKNYIEFYIENQKDIDIEFDLLLMNSMDNIGFFEGVKNFMLLESINKKQFQSFIKSNASTFNEKVSSSIIRQIETIDSEDSLNYFKNVTLAQLKLSQYSISLSEFDDYFTEREDLIKERHEQEVSLDVEEEEQDDAKMFDEDEIFKLEMFE